VLRKAASTAKQWGCFFVSTYNSSTCKSGEAVMLKFHIAQHSRDNELMRSLITNLGCGRIELILATKLAASLGSLFCSNKI